MEGLLTFILVCIALFYLLRFLGRIFLGRWLARKQEQFSRGFGGYSAGNSQRDGRKTRKEGEVRVEQRVRVDKKVSRSVGEYVEYEEVEAEETIEEK